MDPTIRLTSDLVSPNYNQVVLLAGKFRIIIGLLPTDDRYQKLSLPTGVFTYIPHIMQDRRSWENDFQSLEDQIKVNQMKSSLTFTLNETFGDDTRIYWKLVKIPDLARTRYDIFFQLYFETYPVELSIDNDLRETFRLASLNMMGCLLLDSDHLAVDAPRWYIRECFRDTIDDLQLSPLVEGPTTGTLYLFGNLMNDDDLKDLIQKVTQSIRNNMEIGIWPKNTPEWYIENKNLILGPNGQYLFHPDNSRTISRLGRSAYEDFHMWIGTVESLNQLWTGISQLSPGCRSQVSIDIQPHGIRMLFRSRKLNHLIEILNISTVIGESTLNINIDIQFDKPLDPSIETIKIWNQTIQDHCYLLNSINKIKS